MPKIKIKTHSGAKKRFSLTKTGKVKRAMTKKLSLIHISFSLSQDIGVSVQEAKEYMDKYFAHYSGVRAYMDGVVERCV